MRKIQIAISSGLCIRLTWNLTGSGGQQQRLRGWSRMVVNQFQDGGRPPFWKSIYRHISVKIIRFSWNFVHSSRVWTGWTSRDQQWQSCIGHRLRVQQLHWTSTPSSTERISCLFSSHLCNVIIFHLSIFVACLLIKMLVRTTWSARVFRRNCHRYLSARNSSVSK